MINSIIGGNIRRWRQFKGYQQAAFAEKIGVTVVTLSKYENGRCEMPTSMLITIADALEICVSKVAATSDAGIN